MNNLSEYKLLYLIKYNKEIQNRLEININDYKNYKENKKIILKIIPQENTEGKFINIASNKYYQFLIHVYFNNNPKEIQQYSIKKKDKIKSIKIVLDPEIKSFNKLFYECDSITKISFLRFKRKDITNMSQMFSLCTSLEELDLSKFNTDNVTDMSYMFSNCSSLKKLDLSNFNTKNVTNMNGMFYKCNLLKNLNLSNFNTDNVKSISEMFYYCRGLEELELPKFNNNVSNVSSMFLGCSDELKENIKKRANLLKINLEAFK